MKNKEYTDIHDRNGNPIPYGVPIDFTWWEYPGYELELHLTAKIRRRKGGDIFEFIKDDRGRNCYFTHRLSALNWCSDDLEIIN